MIVPIRILDNNFHLWIYCFCRTYYKVLGSIVHQFQPIFCPCHIAFCSNLYRTLATGKEKIVEQEFVEMFGCRLGNPLDNLPMLRIRITKCLKFITLIDSIGNTACNLYALLLEECLGLLYRSIIYKQHISMCLQIYLINIQLTRNRCPRRF